jgi:hypothetical protein
VVVSDEEKKRQNQLSVDIEILERRITHWADKGFTSHPNFRRAVERKQLLERELEASRLRERYWHDKLENERKSLEEALPTILCNGKLCDQVIADLRHIKHQCVELGWSMREIEKGLPDSPVWNLNLTAEDQEMLKQPRRWGAVVGYGNLILGKHFGKSVSTVADWRKAYRSHVGGRKKARG